jgi:hypothetical protein
MPLVAFASLPDSARVWVFGSGSDLPADSQTTLLSAVDDYLSDWRAHGSPLTVGRDWRDSRFLAIAVDQTDENASGCSLDALFRVLRTQEGRIGSPLLGNAQVYYRDPESGTVRATDRAGFAELARNGAIDGDTCVFDLSVQTVAEWRSHFETPAAKAWHRALLLPG